MNVLILTLILQIIGTQFPLGLTGETHSDPLYCVPGPRNIIILKSITYPDCTKVMKDTTKHIIRPVDIKKDGGKK